ncbi:hypothetical protein LN461_18295 [Xanthomonas arboricola]|uniref:hypothetical protein n=1 Tax=Xanthomonas arboricola TaxID=56448 RepID=UPI001E4EE8D1|nr:hypothetical protein [Xanthomonas arboricola]MCC8671284.1 hypothetical protein [Xanthomonas arboricola]
MAKLFQGARIVPVWLEAARALNNEKNRTALNYVLEIASPTILSQEDKGVLAKIDAKLLQHTPDLTLSTVANTIFPERIYRKHGRPDFYERYLSAIRFGKKKYSWGTYAWRMMERNDPATGGTFNPLERIVRKLRSSKNGSDWKAVYELGILQPEDLFATDLDEPWCELPLPEPALLQNRNLPCLSHLSVKLLDKQVHVSVMYRAHYYATRAMGNLIGLSQLQAFLAAESGFGVGTLTCLSSLAYLDTDAFGGTKDTAELLKNMP